MLTVAAGSGALATVLGAALGRPWLLVAALTVLAGVAREGPRRWLPATVFALVAVLAVLEPATILAPLGGLAAYAIARRPADLTDRVAPLVAAGLIVVAAAGFRAPPPVAPPPVMRTATVADLTVSLVQAGRGVTVLAASARRPPPAPISEVSLDLGGRTVGLFPGAAGRYAGTADLPAAGSAVRATVIVRRAGERLTVPLAWTVPGSSPAPFPLSRAGLLVLAVLTLAAVHRKIAKDVP
ncbi:hypothetical protein [Paractinoplanes globisporus]|uniref:Uncharacterized protein n=1 Tax=Paractinoplanes globisporus TaxID=113565 RepID=A0ABW6WD23_9ACTN|nr:hypothetical protein [Actinoplanes globisporus]